MESLICIQRFLIKKFKRVYFTEYFLVGNLQIRKNNYKNKESVIYIYIYILTSIRTDKDILCKLCAFN